MPVHIRETTLEAIMVKAESFVIESHQVKDGGIKIVNARRILLGLGSKSIAFTIAMALLHACSRKEAGEGIRIMITSGTIPLKERHPAKLGCPDNQRVFEKTTPFLVYRSELKERIGVAVVDLLAVPEAFPCLADQLAVVEVGEVHVVAPEALILMKLVANRPQDRADIARLLEAGVDESEVAAYLAEYAPDFLNRFGELVDDTQ